MRITKADSMQTRTDLIVAALDLFDEQGVSKTTLAQVATRANVTRGAVYWHFSNKDDLFDAMCDFIFDEFEQSMGDKIYSHDCDDFLDDMMFSFNIIKQNVRLQKFIRVISRKWENTTENAGIYNAWEKHLAIEIEHLTALFQLAKDKGKLADNITVEDAVHTVRAVHWGLLISWVTQCDFDLIVVGKIAFSGCIVKLFK